MKKTLSQIFILSIFATLVIVCGFFIEKPSTTGASNSKVITVTFATTPASPTIIKTPLKYNKNFAFSFQFDDGSYDQYENGFKYLYGGTSALRSESYGGIFYTDGSGRSAALSSHPFLGDMIWNSTNYNNGYADIHTGVNLFTWANLTDIYNKGFDIANHSWSHASALTLGANYVYSYPAPHGASTIDYNYEIEQNLSLLSSNSSIPATSEFVPPAGDGNYADPAFNHGYKLFASESSSFTYSGGTVNPSTTGMDVTSNIDLNHLFAYRYFYSSDRFTGATTVNDFVDTLATNSTGSTKLWGIGFTHRVGVATGGSMNWTDYKALMDHISNTYGRVGNDTAWVAPAQEVYEYLAVKQNTGVSTNLVGNVLTITLDTSSVPAGLRRDALSLKVTSNADIQSISYANGEFTAHSENLNTGLINVDWGAVFTSNDFTHVETVVSTAEASRSQTDIDTATTFANFLPASVEKNAFVSRINNIVPVGRRWLINLGVNSATTALDSVSGSSTNGMYWNEVNTNDSFSAEKVSQSLVDTSNVSSSLTVALPQATNTNNDNLKTGSASMEGAQATTDGTGLYPNAKIAKDIVVYSGTESPGKIEIRHLDPAKYYKVILFGSTKNQNGGLTQGYFTVQGSGSVSTQGPLQFYNNVGANVSLSTGGSACTSSCATATFNSVTPNSSGIVFMTWNSLENYTNKCD
ncbi:MAG: hypothetical protein NTX85_02120 [Candidatus Nomurabacteria bacterium]|nr:hypothetical protein [Candidatus Nomurabacteria bacterium]